MDDGSPLSSVILFIVFVLLEAVFYGFGSAIQNVNAGELEKEMEGGGKRAAKLLHIVNRPTGFVNSIQAATSLIGIVTGAAVLGRLGQKFTDFLARSEAAPRPWLAAAGYVAVALFLIILLVSFGIVVPKRFAAKEPKKWGYRALPVVSFVMIVLLPFTWAVNGISYVVLRLAGIDISLDSDNVTEEDIMSMINEGHEQGVLEAGEAEMITNIFELMTRKPGIS